MGKYFHTKYKKAIIIVAIVGDGVSGTFVSTIFLGGFPEFY